MVRDIFAYIWGPPHTPDPRRGKRLLRNAYIIVGVFAFGHNYNTYPVYSEHYEYCTPPNEKEKCTVKDKNPHPVPTGLKALVAGAAWPLYLSVAVQSN